MSDSNRRFPGRISLYAVLGVGWLLAAAESAVAAGGPPAKEVAALLEKEPFSPQTWPAWRTRLLEWIGDKEHNSDAAYLAVTLGLGPHEFFAWYLYGHSWLHQTMDESNQAENLRQAERAYRRSIELNPAFARAHRNLGLVLIYQNAKNPGGPQHIAAAEQLREAQRLEPDLSVAAAWGQLELMRGNHTAAEKQFSAAMADSPKEPSLAYGLAQAVLSQQEYPGGHVKAIKPLVDRFPEDAMLACYHAAALAIDGEIRPAAKELQRVCALGKDPATILSPELVQNIEAAAAPGWIEILAWTMAAFAVLYLCVIGLMALVGWMLAHYTRGLGALRLLGDERESQLVAGGVVARSSGESWLARCYALSIMAGLILFYVSIPFIVVGVVAGTLGGLILVLQMGRVPIKLLVFIVVIGGGMAYAILKSLLARGGSGTFGLLKTREECPKLHQLVADVAQQVDTRPVDQIYLAPGSSIGVHQTGRGPFGMFGVKERVLTLGMSTLGFLTQNELRAILAHEYAHFSHSDTFYSRFIYQVTISIEEMLQGMGASAGVLNYVNPFYWLMFLYYRAFSLLSAGFSRSREFLADRMAASLYGGKVFVAALCKVATEGTLFEMTMYGHITNLLAEDKAMLNMYDAFRSFRDEQLPEQEREELFRTTLAEQDSLFASHPTFSQRVEALDRLPPGGHDNSAPAVDLLDGREALEHELTEFLTAYMHQVRLIQLQPAD